MIKAHAIMEGRDDHWLQNFLKVKKEKKFNVIGIFIRGDYTSTLALERLNKFSDKVVHATSLFDDAAAEAVFSI